MGYENQPQEEVSFLAPRAAVVLLLEFTTILSVWSPKAETWAWQNVVGTCGGDNQQKPKAENVLAETNY